MFNVIRPQNAPACLSKKIYNHEEVITTLRTMFYDKCYLCELDQLHDPEIEHLIPHGGDDALKYDWNNLFYSCSRCNSVKGIGHTGIIDCTDSSINIFAEIACKMNSTPNDPVPIIALKGNDASESIKKTVALLDDCYNLENSALRGISREALINKMYFYFTIYLNIRADLINKTVGANKKKDAEETLEAMLLVTHPFSIFWRWHFLSDNFLLQNYAHLRKGF